MLMSYGEGLALGASLILAIGAQNAYVIRQGVKGEHVFVVAAVCSLVDLLLIGVGAAGVGTLIAQSPLLRMIAAWGGALFLAGYALFAAKAAWDANPGAWEEETGTKKSTSVKVAILTAAGFSLLNPHVYLDTVILLGGLAAQYEGAERVYFAVGAMTASPIWFFAVGYSAIKVAPFFRTTLGARLLDGAVACLMLGLAAMLVWREIG